MKLKCKRIACLLLAAVMTVGFLPASAFRMEAEQAALPMGEEALEAAPAERPAEPMDADDPPAQLATAAELSIPGYTRVTELPTQGLSGKYLIVATYDNNYYMLYPGKTGSGGNNSARLEVSDGVATGYKVGSGTAYDSATLQDNFSAAENTITSDGSTHTIASGQFAAGETWNGYSVSAVGLNGTPYYMFGGSNVYGTNSSSSGGNSGVTLIGSSDTEGYFRLRNTAHNNAQLIFYKTNMSFDQAGGTNADYFPDMMLFQKDPEPSPLPGYNKVTNLSQIKADRQYLIVAQAPDETFYALRLNADGANKNPGQKGHPECTARLAVSGDAVSASAIDANGAATSTSVDMADLLVTITPSTGNDAGKYTIKHGNYWLTMSSSHMVTTDTVTQFELSFVSGDRFQAHASNQPNNRYITFNIKGGGSATHFPNVDSGFCGWSDPQTNYLPVYLYIQGDLPVAPGMALSQMLAGDQIGNANDEENPAGQNSWVFLGGRTAQGQYADIGGARSWAGHFEEWVRYTNAKALQPSGESTTPYFQRHVINAAYTGQTLANVNASWSRVTALKPRAVVYLVEEGGSAEAAFDDNLNALITKALALQNDTGMLVIQTMTQADKTAVDTVVNGLTEEKQARVLPVLSTLTAAQKTDGFPNAQGHLQLAKDLANAVAGYNVSGGTNWPYGAISGSVFTEGWPTKTAVTATHEGFAAPTTPTDAQSAIKNKVEQPGGTPMTWLFMGDSITHGSAWTGGYDSLAQLFEKFVKEDLHRLQDVVINAGSSGATTASTISDLDRRLTKYSPDVVVLMLGTNDQPGSNNDATYRANLRTLLDKIIAKNAVPVLRTPPTSSARDMANAAANIRTVLEESAYQNVILVDHYTAWNNSNWQQVYSSRNNLHPDEAGHLWFVHQLINDMGLWKSDSAICNLEYVAREELASLAAPVIPGYTQVTDLAQLDKTKGYLIVSRDEARNLYAVYPSEAGKNLSAGALPANSTHADVGARTAALTVNGNTVSAKYLKDNSALDMEKLLFKIVPGTGDNNGYMFTSFDGFHLNMTDKMFTNDRDVYLQVTAETANFGQIKISHNGRYMDFTKHGDSTAYGGASAAWGTDFWCPTSRGDRIYLFVNNDSAVVAPTAKGDLQDFYDEVASLNNNDSAYTPATWAAFEAARTAAQTLLADESQTDDDAQVFVDAHTTLDNAHRYLQPVPTIPTVPTTGATKVEDWKTMVPASGATQNQPFNAGTGGSNQFRIPAIITLQHQTGDNADKNGRLVTAADARWNQGGDGANLDTIVSYSDDNGANWSYHFANYFGDSTNVKTPHGATFIDPQLTEGKDGTIYLMVDLYPGGVALNTSPEQPQVSTGYAVIDGVKRMTLYTTPGVATQSETNYSYYIGDFTEGYAQVMEVVPNGADTFSGFYVDEYYYLYHTEGAFNAKTPANDKIYCQRLGDSGTYVQQNVFFRNASLHVRTATFLWIVTSKDGGETWGKPMIINDQVHQGDYRFYGVGPGAGLCVDTADSTNPNKIPDGTLVFPIYNNEGETARFLYSTDNGVHWHMGNAATELGARDSSESCLVQIDDVTIRHLYRDSWQTASRPVRYTDYTWNNQTQTWTTGDIVSVNGANRWGACQMAAIKYSRQVDGKDVILYSAPGGTSGRNNGIIHAFLVNADKTLTLYNTYKVNENNATYCYSSLTETKDGDIALLYEYEGTAITLKIIPIEDILPDIDSQPTGVNLDKTTATIYTNTTETAERKHTVRLTASVLPFTAEQTVTWASSNEDVATVSNEGLVTGVGNGTAVITATAARGIFASCTVTVNTRMETITVKNGGAAVGSAPVKVYTNEGPGHSVTLTAETSPANVTHPALNWTRPDGAKGQLILSDRGENGQSITITAVPGEKNVGEVTVEVASAEHTDTKTTFKVHVIRRLEHDVTISINGVNDPTKAPQFDQTLEADINALQMTDGGKDALTYQWKRNGTAISGAVAKTYTLTRDDIGAVISVEVTAGANSFYEGTRTATRTQAVDKKDGPLTGPQNLTGTAPTVADATDGSISGFGDDFALYEYHLVGTVDSEWHNVEAATVTDLAAGTYQVRAKATDTHKAGGVSVVTVPAAGTTTYAIALGAMTNGRVSRSDSVAEAGATVTLTVLPETGYRLTADGLQVKKADNSTVTVTKVAGKDNEYTFLMPGEVVTVTAAFEQLRFTVTHELTHLRCSKLGGDSHQVPYGESVAIELVADGGYVLPLRKDIKIYTPDGVAITGWDITDEGVITITGGVTSDLLIVAVGRTATHTVNYTLTNNLKKSEETGSSVAHMAEYNGVLEAEEGYALPEDVIITMGGTLLEEEVDYAYNKDAGEIVIFAGRIYDDVVITAAGVKVGDPVVAVTGVTLNRSQASVTVGGSVTLTATVAPADATTKNVVWITDNDAVATVDETGKVTAVAEGTATITAMTVDGRMTATCAVTVTKASAPSTSSGSSAPAETTKTEVKEDGTKVTTVTKPDGTKVETTETPDGAKAVVETKKDGSKTQTVEQPDGTKSEMNVTKDGDVTITVTDAAGEELVKTEIPAEIPEPETKFEDVTDAAPWAEEAINKVAGLELVKGTGEAKYSPVAPMTRGSLATVLHRLSQGKTDYANTFKDVAQGKFYTEGVAWAAKANVVKGISEDIFAPERIITREQLAVMLARYAKLVGLNTKVDGKALEHFADGEKTGTWAVDGVAWCVENGILKGKSGNALDPTADVTRAEVAVMLDRFISLLK